MIKQTLLLFLGLVSIFDCFADAPRFETKFESSNGEYSMQLHKKKWILTNRNGFLKYSIKDNGFTSMTVLISDNGQNIVVINDCMGDRNIGENTALWIYKKANYLKVTNFQNYLMTHVIFQGLLKALSGLMAIMDS